MTFARRGLIFLFMLVVTIVGSIAFLVGGVYLDARRQVYLDARELGRKERGKMRQEQMNRQDSSQSDYDQKKSNSVFANSNSGNINAVNSNK